MFLRNSESVFPGDENIRPVAAFVSIQLLLGRPFLSQSHTGSTFKVSTLHDYNILGYF